MSGIRIIDVGTFLAGPYAASVLGEFGAEILKVEHPLAGDPMRRFGTATKRHDATLAGSARRAIEIGADRPAPARGVQLFLKLVEEIRRADRKLSTGDHGGVGYRLEGAE
ncbi:MAG: CoA transferase [Candidatus Competibacteraceae bacterium]